MSPRRGLAFLLSAVSLHATVLFQDDFTAAGTTLDLSKWTTEIGPSSFLGRTQLTNWVSGGGQFVVSGGQANLTLNTFNPTGFSLFGTHGKTLTSFQPAGGGVIEFTTRLQLPAAPIQKGIVWGMYLYGCTAGPCASNHDEIDIELVTNALQGSPLQVQLNRYANEPLGAGHGVMANLPGGFNLAIAHDWTIRWSLTQIDFLVDGQLLFSTNTFVPQGAMQANIIAWGPGTEWPAAYDASLQPVNSAGSNQAFTALVDQVTVTDGVPEPPTFGLAGIVLLFFLGRNRLLTRRGSETRSC